MSEIQIPSNMEHLGNRKQLKRTNVFPTMFSEEILREISSYLPEVNFSRLEDLYESVRHGLYYHKVFFHGTFELLPWLSFVVRDCFKYISHLKFKEELNVYELAHMLFNLEGSARSWTLEEIAVDLRVQDGFSLCSFILPIKQFSILKKLDLDVKFECAAGLDQVVLSNEKCLKSLRCNFNSNTAYLNQFINAFQVNSSVKSLSIRGGKASCLTENFFNLNTTLEVLDLKNNFLNSSDAGAIARALRANDALKRLDLSCNYVGAQGGIFIGDALKVNHGLQALNLSLNGLNPEGGCAVGEAIRHNKSLQILTLNCNNIGPKAARAIGESLQLNNTLKHLHLIDNGLESGGLHIAKALRVNTGLHSLRLGKNNLRTKVGIEIARALKTNASLNTLILLQNNIDSEGIAAIGKALFSNTSLETLDLTHNNSSGVGRINLGKALVLNNRLENLELHDVNLNNIGASWIAKGLTANTSLKTLNIYDNEIGMKGGIALAEALMKNKSLQELNLNDNDIGPEGGLAFAKSLMFNTSLQLLQLLNNKIGDNAIMSLERVVAQKKRVQRSRFTCLFVNEDAEEDLA